jgi:hypothetical protein
LSTTQVFEIFFYVKSLTGQPELLPNRKRNRDWRAAAHRDEQEDDEMEEGGEEGEEETRSPASKK